MLGINSFAASPNGKEVAVVSRGDVYVTPLELGDTRRITSTPEQERGLAFGSDGIWFGTSDPDNSKGALLYGNYVIEELPCEKNYGKDLISFEIEINKNNQVYEYPAAYNYDILLSTTALDAATETKTVAAEAGAQVVDTVAYENLTVGRKYTLNTTFPTDETI